MKSPGLLSAIDDTLTPKSDYEKSQRESFLR
jgi:hypothetical protein